MHMSEARVPTASASRYLQQICKHWSHKFAVEIHPRERARAVFETTDIAISLQQTTP